LMDCIASHQPELLEKHDWAKQCQFWHLQVHEDKSATLTCRQDSGYDPAVTQEIPWTDFDLDEIQIWCMPLGDGKHFCLLLPSEY
jgi:hypothetical protein